MGTKEVSTEPSKTGAGECLQNHPATNAGQNNKGLGATVRNFLCEYFKNLDGANPGCNLYSDVIREVERPVIEIALQYSQFNQKRAAEILGINRNTLKKKMDDLGIVSEK